MCGVSVFQKKVILYGSEGNVKVFCSEFVPNQHDQQEMPARNMPRCCVQIADPIILSARVVDACDCGCKCDCCCSCCNIPDCICERYGGHFCDGRDGKSSSS